MKVPTGKIVASSTGGEGQPARLLADHRSPGFTGYLKTRMNMIQGWLVFEGGQPMAAIYEDPSQEGEDALVSLIAAAEQKACVLTVHEVKVDLFLEYYPNAGIEASLVEDLLQMAASKDPAVGSSPSASPGPKKSKASGILPHLTFESYVVGSENDFVVGACRKVAGEPATSYNPLYIHGESGLGKTHLLHGIGNQIVDNFPDLKVVYVTTEKFSLELIDATRAASLEEFHERYRDADVLLVDDIQFLAGEQKTQEEFFHTFNQLHDDNKQIVITGDRSPKELEVLTERLRTRFEGGLITNISAPSADTRLAILKKKAEEEALEVPEAALAVAAEHITENIRSLEGAILRIKAYAEMAGKPVDLSLVLQSLGLPGAEDLGDQSTRTLATEESRLLEHLTFETYVVGKSNTFVHAAAESVARAPADAYNPLFIHGGSGMGKTHLLNAIGHRVHKNFPDMTVTYVNTEAFSNELIDAIKSGEMDEFRDRYRTVDVLMIDDIQFLAREEKTQDEFYHTFNALHDAKKQIVITSDKPPKELQVLESKLRTRFEGGLITEIKPLDLETRIAILSQKCEREGFTIPADALELIAAHTTSNVRELEGGLLRVKALAEVHGGRADRDLVKDALGIMVTDESPPSQDPEPGAAPAIAPSPPPTSSHPAAEVKIEKGRTYMFKGTELDQAFEAFLRRLGEGAIGVCISRMSPKRLNGKYDVGGATVRWLTDRDASSDPAIIPPALESMVFTIEEFMDDNPETVILLDGLEYLISTNGFKPVLNFIRHLVDSISDKDSTGIIPLSPDAISPQELSMLEREMEPVE